jgi:hypothetical protein
LKATAQTLPVVASVEKTWFAVFSDLIKARLTFLVLLTTLVGFYISFRGPLDWMLLLHTMLGTALVASGAAALNQLLEREHDAKMRRTEDRPLPSGRLQPETVLIIGGACGGLGLIYLAVAVNLLTSLLGALTLASYLFVYTPLKRVTTLNTIVGAIPGALPPLMGWVAARGELSPEGWSLFAILFFCPCGIYDAARGGSRRPTHGTPGGQPYARPAAGQFVSLFVSFGRTALFVRGACLGFGLLVVCAAVFAAPHRSPRAPALFCVHIIFAAAAGLDGV